MLKPFQIRSVYKHGSWDRETLSSQQLQGLEDNHDTAQGLAHPVRYSQFGLNKTVQLSAAQYDDLAENHPPARLTYNDDDDGEIITVSTRRISYGLHADTSRLALPLNCLSA